MSHESSVSGTSPTMLKGRLTLGTTWLAVMVSSSSTAAASSALSSSSGGVSPPAFLGEAELAPWHREKEAEGVEGAAGCCERHCCASQLQAGGAFAGSGCWCSWSPPNRINESSWMA